MSKIILVIMLIFSFSQYLHAASIVDLTCNKGQVVLARGMHEGHTKSSAKKDFPPPAIYFDLATEKFVSDSYKKKSYIDLSYFINGKLLLPECQGTLIETTKAGFKD